MTIVAYDTLNREQVIKNLRSNLPEPLRQLNSFVVFKYAPPKKPGGKKNKVPYYVRTHTRRVGTQGEPDDLRNMATFLDALKLYQKDSSFAGLGVCALPQNQLSFIDIDNCIDHTGKPNKLAEELLRWRTYTEVSPSGKGLRMVVNGDMALDGKNHELGIEAFSHKGFVTLTGQPFDADNGRSVRTLTPQQTERLHALVRKEQATAAQDETTPASIPTLLTEANLPAVKQTLRRISADIDENAWVKVGMALHSADPNPNGNGFKLWVKWSKTCEERFANTSVEQMRNQHWASFKQQSGITLRSLKHFAKEYPAQLKSPDLIVPIVNDAIVGAEDIVLQQLCPGMFDQYGAYIFIGRGKIGKSRVYGYIAAAALTGQKVFGFEFKKKCRVLLLALEEDVSVVKHRLESLYVDITNVNLSVIDRALFKENAERYKDDYTYLQWLEATIKQTRPDLVIVDPLVNMRMVWGNATGAKNSDQVTERDYKLAAEIDDLAVKYKIVISFSMHGRKRGQGFKTGDFDPFEMVGTTSWTIAGATGALVLLDKPGSKPLEEDTSGDFEYVFSMRNRYSKGDTHLQLHFRKDGSIINAGPYFEVQRSMVQEEVLETIKEMTDQMEDGAYVTAEDIGRACDPRKHRKSVARLLGRFLAKNELYNGYRLEARTGIGFRLVRAK